MVCFFSYFQKGFNEDLKLDDLQTFFSQYGKVGRIDAVMNYTVSSTALLQTEYIQMRRTGPPEKKFKVHMYKINIHFS